MECGFGSSLFGGKEGDEIRGQCLGGTWSKSRGVGQIICRVMGV